MQCVPDGVNATPSSTRSQHARHSRRLFAYLDQPHRACDRDPRAAFTVEAWGTAAWLPAPPKNLFLKDKKDALFLVVALEDA